MVTAQGKKAIGQSLFRGKRFNPTTGEPEEEKKLGLAKPTIGANAFQTKFHVDDEVVSQEEFVKVREERRREADTPEDGRPAITPEQFQEQQEVSKTPSLLQTQEQQEDQQRLTLTQQVAKVGLTIPVAAGNAITGILEKVTGKEFGRTDVTEFSQTTGGQILGTAIVGTALATAGIFAYETYLGTLSAQQLINIAGSRALPTATKLPAIKTLTSLTSSKLLGIGAIGSFPRIVGNTLRNTISAQGQFIKEVEEDVLLRRGSLIQARQDLDDIEIEILRLESSLDSWSRFDALSWATSGVKNSVEIELTKKQLENTRIMLFGVA